VSQSLIINGRRDKNRREGRGGEGKGREKVLLLTL
jgi:hypothetical protein